MKRLPLYLFFARRRAGLKKALIMLFLLVYQVTMLPAAAIAQEAMIVGAETVTPVPSVTIDPVATLDPEVKAEIAKTTDEAGPTPGPDPSPVLDRTPSNFSAILRGVKRIRKLGKKVYRAVEPVPVIVDDAGSENLTAVLRHNGKDITPMYREIVNGDMRVFSIQPPSALTPGSYEVVVKDDAGKTYTQDFSWGVLAINTDKSIYKPGETASLAIGVLDENGDMVCDADVTLAIRSPAGSETRMSTTEGDIRVNEECFVKDVTIRPDYEVTYEVEEEGEYTMQLTAVTHNDTYSISDTFSVKRNVPFDVRRTTATRIYPFKPYEVTLTVKANQDFNGRVSEIVPEHFKIQDQPGGKEDVEVAIVDNKEEVLSAAVSRLGMPFEGKYKQTLGFGEQITDPALKSLYEQFKLAGHDGVDFDMPVGTPILAVDKGTVTLAGDGDYGTTVVIQHAWGKSYYGHLSKIIVPLGKEVSKGQFIARSGNTGLSTGAHLHFGIKPAEAAGDNGYYGKVNPAAFLPEGETEATGYGVKFLNWDLSLRKGEQVTLTYTYDAPDESPQFYTLGPLAFYENDRVVFKEERSWQIAVDDHGGTHMLLFWDPANGSAPSGWSVVTTYDGRFIRGESAANATTTGGNATHTPAVSGSVTLSVPSSGRAAAGANTVSSYGHTHGTPSVTVGSDDNLPAFRSMQLIRYDSGTPSTIPANAIALFDASPGMPGSGWTRVTAQDANMIRVNSSVATGGSDTHTHSLTWGSLTAASGQITTGSNTNNQGATTTHTHTAPSATNSDSQTSLPAYVHAVVASADSNTSAPTGMIAMFDGAPPASYSIQSDSGGTFYQRFVRGNTVGNVGTTGGSATHSHGASVSGNSGAASANARGTSTAGTAAAGNGHTHTLTANFTAGDDHTPQYVNLVFAEKVDVADLTQTHYRWRNDDGSETTATWRRGEDVSATADNGVNRRLRIQISNEGTLTSGSTTYRLEYGLKSTTCAAIGTWTQVPATATSEDFEMFNSSNLTDGNATTDVSGGLTNENTTFVAGQVKDTGSQTTGITLTTSEFTEIEYSIAVTANPTPGEEFCFRLTNAGSTTNFTYSSYAELTVGDPVIDVKHYRWRNDDGGEEAITNQTVSLLPTGQGSNTGWGSTGCTNDTAEWECVDDNSTADSSNDGTGTHLSTTTGGARSSFTLNNSQVPAGSTVSQIQIFMLGAEVAGAGGDATVRAFYDVGGGDQDCASTSAFGGTTYTSQSCTFSSLSLTDTDIDNMEIGVLFNSNDPTITKMYVTVTYSRPAATWKQSEDTAHTGQETGENIRLRFAVANTGDIAANRNFRLEYSPKSGVSCGDDESFTTVPVTAASEHFEMTTTGNYADSDASVTLLTGTGLGSFLAGKLIEDPSNSSGTFSFTNANYSEFEYNFQATASAEGEYCFRLSDNGTVLDAYTVYPELTVSAGGPTMELTMRHGKWFSSGQKQAFTF